MDTIYTLRDAVNERNDMEEAAESRARRTIRSISLDDAAAELNLHPAIGVLQTASGKPKYYAYIRGQYTEGSPDVLTKKLSRS
jgi:uncharacterized ParB-like nuclease family protein